MDKSHKVLWVKSSINKIMEVIDKILNIYRGDLFSFLSFKFVNYINVSSKSLTVRDFTTNNSNRMTGTVTSHNRDQKSWDHSYSILTSGFRLQQDFWYRTVCSTVWTKRVSNQVPSSQFVKSKCNSVRKPHVTWEWTKNP